ncbi:hypothetical protein Van01_21290 [Micromonospora andamanensis]|uniref:Ferritin-like domain-containing protein n=1 Tax=Micromonospora andamanensis TaxID=1287068 RepID=A0ABQ4HTH8_9ACTN|nr:hypothetical protein Van01_21290 [Micromonospora andamanensis]
MGAIPHAYPAGPVSASVARVSRHSVSSSIDTHLDWNYDDRVGSTFRTLYERGVRAQWSADDVDWSVPVPYGAPLPDDSAFAMSAFRASPLAARGRPMWDAFRWELQVWMVSQFLHGEQAAMVVAGRLVGSLPDLDSKLCAASQAIDEARHLDVFSRYLREKVGDSYPVSPPLRELLDDVLLESRWDVTALGMQIMVEAVAMAAFRLAESTFHDDLIKDLTRRVGRDEARHVSFGVLSLEGLYQQLTTAERAEREGLVLDAAELIRRRFLLVDIWERLDVDPRVGAEFAATDPLMVRYRQAVFSRVCRALRQVDLLTDRVVGGLIGLDLLPTTGR